ncbi:MAG: hypothetical protein M1825_000693 [Sarcosagium campestre]|nr:MAG: hypothetical protein M1825_000693 [Sarcosagium campestre]
MPVVPGRLQAVDLNTKKLKSVTLPEQIKCLACKKIRDQSYYSQKQLNDLAFRISRNGPVPMNRTAIKCRQCTGGQVTEMACYICEEVKGLDGFSKAQRRMPDHARCLTCLARHEETEPGLEPDSGSEHSDVEEDETIISEGRSNPFDGATDLGEDVDPDKPFNHLTVENLRLSTISDGIASNENEKPKMSLVSASSVVDDEKTEDGSTRDEFGWITQPRGKVSAAVDGIRFKAYDEHGECHDRVRTASTVMSESDQVVYKPAARVERWAKVKVGTRQRDLPGYGGGIYSDSYGVKKGKSVPMPDDEEIGDNEGTEAVMEW